MTNYEKIKNMSVEKMASKLETMSSHICAHYYTCKKCPFSSLWNGKCDATGFADWLNSEVEE